ncbi:CAAX prenyl protease 2 isoform X3 [Nymphaea colorata]|uniref:CAAX prenyl protease 2 isoform X3 n=1 Tax=Nymphaea colorata TaxID=210225 RepID=UPI00129DA6F8|nr:CAAX prenyl protease 2 isoform X3 [Nymphaea colorata]
MAEPNKWVPRNPELPGAEDGSVSKESALAACFAMALFYVAVLYAPTYVLRLAPASSLNTFMIRRFISVIFASLASILLCACLLPVRNYQGASLILSICGIRLDHLGRAVAIPLCLTSLFYVGSVVSRLLSFSDAWEQEELHQEAYLVRIFKAASQKLVDDAHFVVLNILAWRNYVVAPITEELVFRACMIPLLLCAGFKAYSIIFLSPIFFSLAQIIPFQLKIGSASGSGPPPAHLNHLLELYYGQKYTFSRAVLIVGMQLGYTVMFGWYASFLFLRTGHLIAPIVAHIFCNMMGLPIVFPNTQKATSPDLYNSNTKHCRCWHEFCSWGRTL